jgi:hypothetical protein
MSTSVDVYALPKLPSTATRGPTRMCSCMLALLLVLVLVALAPSIVISLGGEGVSVVVPTTATGEAPIAIPEAAQRFAIAHAQWQAAAAAGAERDDPEVLSGLSAGWRDALESADHAQARLIADVARTLGWLVEQARAPR